MKVLSSFLLLTICLMSPGIFAAGLICKVQSPDIESLTMGQDGGEETVTLHKIKTQSERFLVMQNDDDGKVIAIEDTDLTGGTGHRGIMLIYNLITGKGHLAVNGQIIGVDCKAKQIESFDLSEVFHSLSNQIYF